MGPDTINGPALGDQRALVTGASSGIGEAIVRRFADASAAVVINYRSGREDAERIADDIQEKGGKAFAVQGDVCVSAPNCNPTRKQTLRLNFLEN